MSANYIHGMKPQQKVIAGVAAVVVAILFVWMLSRGSKRGMYGAVPTVYPTPMATLPVMPAAVTMAPSWSTMSISPTLMPELVGYAGPGDDDFGPVN